MLEVYSSASGTRLHMGSVAPNDALPGFQELGAYSILRSDALSLLYIDDTPVPTQPDASFWEWRPEFYSGRVTVEVVSPQSFKPTIYYFDVSPDQEKADDAQFLRYLQEISEYLPEYLLGSEPAQTGLGGKSPLVHLWVSYLRLRTHAAAYLAALQMIMARPITRLKYLRERIELHRAKRIDAVTLAALRSNPALLQALGQAKAETATDKAAIRDTRVNVPFHEPSVDNPSNRLILYQLHAIVKQIAWVRGELMNHLVSEHDAASEVRKSIPRRIGFLDKMARTLRQMTVSEPFLSVSLWSPHASALNAVSSNPVYDRAHKLGLAILKRGVSTLTPDEMQYLSTTWRVYESWCFCAIARTLEKTYPDYTWILHRQPKYADCLLEGRNGDRVIRLYDQLVCPSLEASNSYGYMSISRERRPDFVLEFETNGVREFVCIDAKYRVSRQGLLDGMASAHIYQNALKLLGHPPMASCLVAPHVKNAAVLAEHRYWEQYQVACFTLASKDDVDLLLATISAQFSHWEARIK